MNASVHLLRSCVPATVHLQSEIPADHPSVGILGQERMGTGVLLGASGEIVTAHYVVIGATAVQVVWSDGTAVPGTVESIDYESGLAVVSVGESRSAPLPTRPVDEVRVGEEVFVVGSDGTGRRVGTGAVTAIAPFDAFWEYMLDRAIYSSAANPGLGGGPLVDHRGAVVGIACLSIAQVGRSTLAVPACRARDLVGSVHESSAARAPGAPRAWLGVTCYELRGHVLLAGVIPDTPAARAGLEPGDIVVAIDGAPIAERRDFYARLWRRRSGDTVTLRIVREDETRELTVQLTSMDEFFS